MTDPNKAAVTESNAEFVARMSRQKSMIVTPLDFNRLIALAEERVMIEEYSLTVSRFDIDGEWEVMPQDASGEAREDLSTALRSVVAKVGEGNG